MEQTNDKFRLLSKSAAASMLGIGKKTLGKLIEEGRMKIIVLNKQIKIPLSEIKRFIEESTQTLSTADILTKHLPVFKFSSYSKKKAIARESKKNINTDNLFAQIRKEVLNGNCIQEK